MGRVLGVRRLSHDTDASTLIERQGESIEHWAMAHGHTVVAMTQDTDVSGSVAPHYRDDLGPWLTDRAKLTQWNILCVAKLDRLTRALDVEHGLSAAQLDEEVVEVIRVASLFERPAVCELHRHEVDARALVVGGHHAAAPLLSL